MLEEKKTKPINGIQKLHSVKFIVYYNIKNFNSNVTKKVLLQ